MKLRSSDRIVFFGDSITEQGEQQNGYVALIRKSLHEKYPGITILGAGVSGNRVPQLQERLDRDVLSSKPSIVVIYIGINDVWHFEKHEGGTPLDLYKAGLQDVVSRMKKSGARVILCTPSVIGECHHGENSFDGMLDNYSRISRQVAEELGAVLCDLRSAFIRFLAAHNPDNVEQGILTLDTVHLNDAGNRLVADEILSVFGE